MSFVRRIDQNVAKYRIDIQLKKWWWSSFVCVVDAVLQSVLVLYRINKDEGTRLAFRRDVGNAIFLKYSKEGRLSSSHVGIRNIPSDVCYDDKKHYQVQSEHRRIQNPFKHLRWSVLAQIVNSLKSLIHSAKTLHLRYLKGLWISLRRKKQGSCKVCK